MYDTFKASITGTIYSYGRISRRTQNDDRQIMQLKDVSDEMVIEQVSADSPDRPKFEGLLKKLKRGDMLIVLDLDRAFRNMVDAIMVLHDLTQRGVHFNILNSSMDLTSRSGRLMYVIKAHYAEEELAVIRRRTREGLAAARKRGVKLGRPFALSSSQIISAYQIMTEQGIPLYKVAKRYGVAHSTLALSFERMGLVA